VHNGNGVRNGNGKRWLLIGLAILAGFWLLSDAYDDGFRDAMIASGQGGSIWRYHDGPEFPWGLLIIGGICYIAWRKGAFDRLGGPGGPYGGGSGIERYGNGGGYVRGQGPAPQDGPRSGPAFRGPRGFFDDWHRQAHEAGQAFHAAPAEPAAPAAGQAAPQTSASNGAPGGGVHYAPPPPPPAPDYWASMVRGAAEGTSAPQAPVSPPPAPEAGTDGPRDATGSSPERW
jgi:hypothetical protein